MKEEFSLADYTPTESDLLKRKQFEEENDGTFQFGFFLYYSKLFIELVLAKMNKSSRGNSNHSD